MKRTAKYDTHCHFYSTILGCQLLRLAVFRCSGSVLVNMVKAAKHARRESDTLYGR